MLHPDEYQVVSADSHLEVAPSRWAPYVDAAFASWVPRLVDLRGGGEGWLIDPNHDHDDHPVMEVPAGEPAPVGAGDGEQRLSEMFLDGVDAELLYPTIAAWNVGHTDLPHEVEIALTRAYNDWLSMEFCAADPDRLWGAAIVPTPAGAAAEELRRVKNLPGVRTVSLTHWPSGQPWPTPEDDVFWQAAVDENFPISFHISFGGGADADRTRGREQGEPTGAQLLCPFATSSAYVVMQLIAAGVFDRFPTLRIAVGESGAGWVPFFAEQGDINFNRYGFRPQVLNVRPPSYYVRKHFLFGILEDQHAVRVRDVIGTEALLWGSDFPHGASEWPASQDQLRRMFEGVPDADRRRIVAGNALDFYRIGASDEEATK